MLRRDRGGTEIREKGRLQLCADQGEWRGGRQAPPLEKPGPSQMRAVKIRMLLTGRDI